MLLIDFNPRFTRPAALFAPLAMRRLACIGLSALAFSGSSFAQDVINVTPGTNSLQLDPANFANGLTLNVPEGVTLGDLLILPFADPASLDNPPPFEINISGTLGGAVVDAGNFDLSALVPISSLNIASTGSVSNLSIGGGANIVNNGAISQIPTTNSGAGFAPTVFLSTAFNDASGSNRSFSITNNGSIFASGESLAGGMFANTIAVLGGGTVPGTVSLNLNNTGSISLGPDATGTLVRWRDADDIVVTNSGTMNVGFLSDAGGFDAEPIIFQRDNSTTPGLQFDDTVSITNEASGQLAGARIILASPFDGSQNYNITFNNNGSIVASGADFASTADPGGAAFLINGQSSFTNTGSILIDGSLLDTGNGSGGFLNQFIEFGGTPEQSDFDAQRITFVNSATGVIDATGEGILFGSGSITNDGTLIARGADIGYGILASAPTLVNAPQDLWNDSVDVANSGVIQAGFAGVAKEAGVVNLNLTNSGTIEILQNTTFQPSAVLLSTGTMSIVNEAAGVIRGPSAISGSGTSLAVVNDGLIEGQIGFDGVTSIENDGRIIGDINLGTAGDTVGGSGTFEGSVFLGDGDDTFVAEGGLTVTGTVFGGNGFNTVRFLNGGLGNGVNSVIGDFQEFSAVVFDGSFTLADGIADTVSFDASDLSFATDAVFVVDALDDGSGDLLINTGPIVLNGGEVQAQSNDAAWSVARDFTILRSDTSLTGTFDSASSNQPYLDATLAYTPTSVILSLERIDGLIQGDILETTNAQQLSVATRVIPEIIQSQVSSSISKLLGSSGGTTSGAVAGTVGFATGLSAGDEMAADAGATGSVWLNLTPTRYDQRAVLPGAVGLQEIDGETVNFLAGVDRLVGSRFVAGAFLGYEDSEVEYRAISGFQENDGYLVGIYGGVAFNHWLYSSVNLNWAQLDNELEERAFDSPLIQRANYDSERLSIGIDLTAALQRGDMSYLAKIAYNHSEETYDAYRTGRGEVVQLEDLSLGRFSLSGEVSYQGEQWNPYLSASYEIDSDVSDTVTDDNGFVINAGLRATRGERLRFEAYIATVTSRSNENQELLGFNVNYAF